MPSRVHETCPNCGAPAPDALAWAQMAVCGSCNTTLYRLGSGLGVAAPAGEMADVPLLVALGDHVAVSGRWMTAVGHARFSYGPGWWDEFWLAGDAGEEGLWLSIDEGDVILQSPLSDPAHGLPTRPTLGDHIALIDEDFTVTETGAGVCTALRGAFPERLAVGDRFSYANLTGGRGGLLSAETDGSGTTWFRGVWIDPFALRVRRG